RPKAGHDTEGGAHHRAARGGPDTGSRLFLSARSESALRSLIARYREHLATTTDTFADICHTAATGRARLPWWVLVDSPEALATAVPSKAPPPALPPTSGRKVALPLTPFERQRFWIDAAPDTAIPPPTPSTATDPHASPLLGRRLSLPFAAETRWESTISPGHPDLGFLAEHVVGERHVVPAACFVAMALAARPGHALEELRIPAPLTPGERTVHTILAGDTIRIASVAPDGSDPVLHATARLVPAPSPGPAPLAPLGTPLAAEALYDAMARSGVRHGPAFRLLDAIRRQDGHATATLRPAPGETRFAIHPARLDAALQLVAAALPETAGQFVPTRIARLVLHHAIGAEATVHARARHTPQGIEAEVTVLDAQGIALEVAGLLFRAAGADGATGAPTGAPGRGDSNGDESARGSGDQGGFYRIAWTPAPLSDAPPGPDFLPPPADLAAALDAAGTALAARHGTEAYAAMAQGLEDAATSYAVRARRGTLRRRPGHGGRDRRPAPLRRRARRRAHRPAGAARAPLPGRGGWRRRLLRDLSLRPRGERPADRGRRPPRRHLAPRPRAARAGSGRRDRRCDRRRPG
ncbi:MAG: polyketide synthase dehydratase domain-containing protein, partial [Rhodospirillales bacterium]|nr:polyketide synthase dehydratase domain-containing protein [Rhodospirillales bacterium]